MLFRPIWKTKNVRDEEKAIAAVRQIDDPDKLQWIALNAPLESVAAAAVEGIDDPRLLELIAGAAKPTPAQKAKARIGSPEVLKRVALNWEDGQSVDAAEKIADQRALAEIAEKGKNPEARKAAARRIRDAGVARELVDRLSMLDGPIAAELVAQCEDEETLKAIRQRFPDSPAVMLTTSAKLSGIRRQTAKKQAAVAETLRANREKAELAAFFTRARQSAGALIPAFVCPDCGGGIEFVVDFEYSDSSSDAYHDIYTARCTACGAAGASRWAPMADGWKLDLVERREPASGSGMGICPLCRKPRLSRTELRYFKSGETCTCDGGVRTAFPPVIVKVRYL